MSRNTLEGEWEEERTNCNHQDLSRSHHVDNAIGVPEYLEHHLLLILGGGSVLRMRARMNDTVHVEVKVVKLFAIWVWPSCIDGNRRSIFERDGLILNHWRDDLGILVGKPSESRRNTHLAGCAFVVWPKTSRRLLARIEGRTRQAQKPASKGSGCFYRTGRIGVLETKAVRSREMKAIAMNRVSSDEGYAGGECDAACREDPLRISPCRPCPSLSQGLSSWCGAGVGLEAPTVMQLSGDKLSRMT